MVNINGKNWKKEYKLGKMTVKRNESPEALSTQHWHNLKQEVLQ